MAQQQPRRLFRVYVLGCSLLTTGRQAHDHGRHSLLSPIGNVFTSWLPDCPNRQKKFLLWPCASACQVSHALHSRSHTKARIGCQSLRYRHGASRGQSHQLPWNKKASHVSRWRNCSYGVQLKEMPPDSQSSLRGGRAECNQSRQPWHTS